MDLNLINSIDEQKHLRELNMFFSRNFMVTIIDDKENVLFYPCMISNFSVDSKKLFVTVYDLIVKENVEETLDWLIGGNFFKKSPKVKIVLSRLDAAGVEIYHVNYSDCVLKNYHGKNFTYKNNEPYQWYLEFSIGDKEIVKTNKYNFKSKSYYDIKEKPIEFFKKNTVTDEEIKEKELAILKNSNKMLDEAVNEVKAKTSIAEERKQSIMRQVRNAKNENKKNAHRFYGASLDSFDFKNISKSIEKEIEKIEDKINK